MPVRNEARHDLALEPRALGNLDVVIAEHGVERDRALAAMRRARRRLRRATTRVRRARGTRNTVAPRSRARGTRVPSRASRRDRSCRRASRARRRAGGAARLRARRPRASGVATSGTSWATRPHRRTRRTRGARDPAGRHRRRARRPTRREHHRCDDDRCEPGLRRVSMSRRIAAQLRARAALRRCGAPPRGP